MEVRKLQTFEYAAPSTLQGALALLQVKGNRARVLSGGTDLIVQVREDRRHLDTMIDIKKIPELMEMRYDPDSRPSPGRLCPLLPDL